MSKVADEDGEEVGRIRVVRPRWSGVILVCGKCLKRVEDGKALRRALKDETKRPIAGSHRRKVRLVKTACVGLCPRRAVVLASAATLAAGEVVLVRGADEIAAVMPRLLPPTL